ncbi:MAG TPA: aminotransferase class I/II-fold pyridoxal phosphate-dependent enzyme [Gemmatimonadaceae bacterium]|nr:aminotransferase class I/II-fold pyridoxal phosphate-dependent enzyme [Gemmatimonadaceae bacterium]
MHHAELPADRSHDRASPLDAPSPLDLDHATMQRLGRDVADLVAAHLATLRDQPVIRTLDRPAAQALITAPPPERGIEFDQLIETLRERVFPYAVREPHPGFMAYVPGCPTFPALLGDWLATGYNFFAGVWSVAAGPNAVELTVLDWMREWIGMPEGAGGLLTSGGSVATLTAMIAARHAVVGDDASLMPRLAIYTSDQAHSSVVRAAWIAGVPRAQVRQLPVDDAYRMRMDALEDAIARDRAAGLVPLMIVASAGTTNTGAVDPLPQLADLAARERVWLHVDAAYAGFAAMTERGRALLDGLGRADSVTLDPHKWLYVPFECGCLLASDPARLRDAFTIIPEYLHDVRAAGANVNFADYGEQLTRSARALKVWLSVSYFGTAALRRTIESRIALAEEAERLLRAEEGIEILSSAQLAVLCFRMHPAGMDDPAALDALNERVLAAVAQGGRVYLSSTRLRGAFALRICVLGFRTTAGDIRALVRAVTSAARDALPQP